MKKSLEKDYIEDYNQKQIREILRGRVQFPTGGIVRDPLQMQWLIW